MDKEKNTLPPLANDIEEQVADYAIANAWRGMEISQDLFHEYHIRGKALYNSLAEEYRILCTEPGRTQCMYGEKPITQFLNFNEMGKTSKDTFYMLVGEGDSAVDDAESIDRIESFKLIAGPFMVMLKEKAPYGDGQYRELNNYLGLLRLKNKNLTLYANAFVPFHKGFTGYFHAYVFNQCVMFEEFHQYHDRPPARWAIRNSRYAEELKKFADDYAERFAFRVESLDEMENYFTTMERDNFFKHYNEDFFERLRHQYDTTA